MAWCEPYPSYDDLIEVIEEEDQPVLRQLEHSAPQLTSSVNTPTPSHTKYSPQPTPIEQPEVPHLEEPDSIPMLEYDDSGRPMGHEVCVEAVAVEGDNDRDQVDTVGESCELHKCRPDDDETDDNSTKYSPQPTPIEQPEVPHPEEPDSIPMLEYDDSCPKTPCLVADDNITMCGRVKNFFIRCRGLLDIPLVLVFGILLYLVDVGSDVMAAVDHFEEGNPVWGSLTITFIVLPALCWAAVSWTWWYYDRQKREDLYETHRMKRMRRMRMLLAVLLLDPLTR